MDKIRQFFFQFDLYTSHRNIESKSLNDTYLNNIEILFLLDYIGLFYFIVKYFTFKKSNLHSHFKLADLVQKGQFALSIQIDKYENCGL